MTSDKKIRTVIELEHVYNGDELKIGTTRVVVCPHCHGTKADRPDAVHRCQRCQGKGHIRTRQQFAGFVFENDEYCPVCRGAGNIIDEQCHFCHGNGLVREDVEYIFKVPKGMEEGHLIKKEGQADEQIGYDSGDLYIELVTKKHRVFTREGSNLRFQIKISLLEAMTGFKRSFVHLDGRKVEYGRDEVTPHMHELVLKGEGLPSKPSYGDLIVTIFVEFPRSLTEENKNLLKKVME
eukprot:TRINITY_DN6389_c0_g1_i2.p1 TRINITY_DN6389_c0_g1~~TRINITY_DN6389_c0_g1_i2.p1  ORF type:complete len:237 (-),score=42.96 TRINITY_DN6389_c0_g1_i2:45-755(-)